ncbi:hypothetical protein FJZ19_03370 [Candidatus Pacearchaeota archaeon]|nr:hypothetical protein [Candidatus Pacearchaeota archaeon]
MILPNEITPELAYLCGVFAGDGSIGYRENKKEYCIKCVGNPKDEQEYYNELIANLIKKLFNLEIKPKFHDKKTTYGVSIYSKSLVKYLTEFIGLPLGKKYSKLGIPKIFLKDKRLINNFISGVADTDFHLAIKRGYYPVIKGVSKSKVFIEEIKKFLENDGFKVCTYERKQFDDRVNKEIITYHIELSGYKQFLKWMNDIGFKHPKNQDKIDRLI